MKNIKLNMLNSFKNMLAYYKIFISVFITLILVQGAKFVGFNAVPECPSQNKHVKQIVMPYLSKPNIMQLTVGPGDNIINILKSSGISISEAHSIVQSLRKVYNVNKVKIGDQVSIQFNGYNRISNIIINNQSTVNNIKIYRNSEGVYHTELINNISDKRILRASDTIRSSLFASAIEQGLSSSTVMKLIKLYSNNVNLQKEILPGSKFDVLFERFFDEEGKAVLDGKILYAALKIDNRNINLYHYTFKNGSDGYFDNQGRGIKKSILQPPMEEGVFRISSKFGTRRHPIYGYTRVHKGVDYAAPRGTPIKAAGDGVIEYMGNKGGYGKYIRIKHNKAYSTAYAHIGRFHKNLKVGSRVKQGQVIAYVGSTGLSTGPHLHYEVIHNGKAIDPLTVSAAVEFKSIPKSEFESFLTLVNNINKKLDTIPYVTEFAMNKISDYKISVTN